MSPSFQKWDNPNMFDLEFLQALNDWQLGGSPVQKRRRGLRLREAAMRLDRVFKRVSLCCFRQVALDKSWVWKLGDTLHLPETISSWTVSPEVAMEFKGGVPPPGWQGVIFAVVPRPEDVVVNLMSLYSDEAFRSACQTSRDRVRRYNEGIGRYGGSQHEVVLEIPSVPITAVHALGGYSSSRETIARQFFGWGPSSLDRQWFDILLVRSGRTLGPHWLCGESKDRVISKMLATVERLRLRYVKEKPFGKFPEPQALGSHP
jgi:hypothetical protein